MESPDPKNNLASKIPTYLLYLAGAAAIYYVGYNVITHFWASPTGRRVAFYTKWY